MKLNAFLLFIILVSSSFAQQKEILLVIKAEPLECSIFIDGRLEGKGKIEKYVKPGEYNIYIKESLLKWSAGDVSEKIIVKGDEEKVERVFRPVSKVFFSTIPQDVRVTVKDSLIGYTPLFINEGLKNIALSRENYLPREISLSSGTVEINMGQPINGRQTSFVKSPWFKVLLGTAAVLGATAAYYKIKADKSYDTYLNNMSQSTLDEVNRYDTVSGIALGALQINFGLLLYLLLSE